MIIKEILAQFSTFFRRYNDDAIDRLHYLHTVIGLSIYMVFLSSKLYLGDPLQCAIHGNSISSDMSKYIHSMCWINGTLYSEDPFEHDVKYNRKINYYQWIVFIIVLQCFLFTFPGIIWNFFLYLNGFDMLHVNKNLMPKLYLDEYSTNTNWSNTQKLIDGVADHLRISFLNKRKSIRKKSKAGGMEAQVDDDKLSDQKSIENGRMLDKATIRRNFPNIRTKPTFPIFLPYIFVKFIYLNMTLLNFLILTWLFDFNYFTYGYQSLRMYFTQPNNVIAQDNIFFPKQAWCDGAMFPKKYGNVYSFQCSLPINLFNQLFYLAFWFWLVNLALMNVISVFYWLLLINRSYRKRIVYNALQLDEHKNLNSSYTAAYYFTNDANKESIDSFLVDKTGLNLSENFNLFFYHVCSCDVVFAIRLISLNSDNLALRDILNNLWDHYLDLEDLKQKEVKQRPILNVKRPNNTKFISVNEKNA